MTGAEFRAAYAAMRRDFSDTDLTGADLSEAVLTGADLDAQPDGAL